jgi:protocatechuate 3,4-dioxygenase beta subunit
MRRSFPRTAIVALASLGLCVGSQASSFAQKAPTLENDPSREKLCLVGGQVVNGDTKEPLRKAHIVLTNKDSQSADPYVAITGSDGRFRIEAILPARYYINVQHVGYVSKSYGEGDDGTSSTVLSLNAGQSVTEMLFRLQRYGVVTGRVLDEDGDPAQGIEVEVVHRYKFQGKAALSVGTRVETNDLGEYRLFDIRPGSYYLRASPPSGNGRIIGKVILGDSILSSVGGYAATYYPSVSEVSRASEIEVRGGDEIPRIDIVLRRVRSHKIRGQIFNAAVENPSSGRTEVWLMPKDEDSDHRMHRAEPDQKSGAFEINDVPDGSYDILASYRDTQGDFMGSVSVGVIGADVDSVRVVITRGAEIRGRLIWEGKTPRQTVTIALREKEGVGHYTAETAADGTFSIRGVMDGLYEFHALSGFNCCYLKSAVAQGMDVLNQGLQVSSGSAASPVELVYSSNTCVIEGTVAGEDGSPAQGAMVVLVSEAKPLGMEAYDWELYRTESTDQYGHFAFDSIPPGSYRAFAWQKIDRESYTDSEFRKGFEQKAAVLSISESEKKTIQLTLLPSLPDQQ